MNRRTPAKPSRTGGPARSAGSVRIVGGRWRGTRLPVPDLAGLRPTSDRVRETLFNWLQPVLPGATVLDLFAGSGALGLEAVSRGAAHAVLVERDPAQATRLREAVGRLQAASQVQVVQDDALHWLAGRADDGPRFRLAFLDPPFDAGLWLPALQALLPWMAADGWLYLESPVEHAPAPPGWTLHRELRTAQARAALYRGPGRADTGGAPDNGRADTLAGANPAP